MASFSYSSVTSTEVPSWVNFSLGEDVRDERRLEQDKKWSEAVADGRSHFSHREFALEYARQFVGAIESFTSVCLLLRGLHCKQSILRKLDLEMVRIIVEYAMPGQTALVEAWQQRCEQQGELRHFFALRQQSAAETFRVYLRKRPLLPFEREQGCYDVARVLGAHELLLHEGRRARNGRLLSMTHHRLRFDRVFSPRHSNDEVCEEAVRPLLRWALRGGKSTLLCFGQTGTGKTHTLYGALRYLSARLSHCAVRLCFYEVHGSSCYDLLNERQRVFLRFDEREELHVRGARVLTIGGEEEGADTEGELSRALAAALKLRSSLVTERNPISSRSHAVCTLEICPREGAERGAETEERVETEGGKKGEAAKRGAVSLAEYLQSRPPASAWGRLTLVDLAGSERNYETTHMTAAQHKESADINLALMALKDCFRAHYFATHPEAQSQRGFNRIPYRSCPLTKVLKDCFERDAAQRTAIIATISPSPIDLQHSLNTTQHVLMMAPQLPGPEALATVEVPKAPDAALSSLPVLAWSPAQVVAWITTVERGRFAHLVLPPGLDGRGLLQLSVGNFADLFTQQERAAREEREGSAWVVSAEETSSIRGISLALFNAIRREELLHTSTR